MQHQNQKPELMNRCILERIRFDFENPEDLPVSIQLFDIRGTLIRSTQIINGSSYILEKDELPKGIYLLLISGIENLPRLIILN